MEFFDLIKERYSVREYKDTPVEEEKLKCILEAGNSAPTGKNIQPQRIYVIKSKEGLEKIDSLTSCRFGAPVVLLFTYNEEEEWHNPLQDGIHAGVEDVSIVATHIMLAAHNIGLGTCWINYFPNKALEAAFSLPENEKSVLLLDLGYPSDDSVPSPIHSEKKSLSETVKYL